MSSEMKILLSAEPIYKRIDHIKHFLTLFKAKGPKPTNLILHMSWELSQNYIKAAEPLEQLTSGNEELAKAQVFNDEASNYYTEAKQNWTKQHQDITEHDFKDLNAKI